MPTVLSSAVIVDLCTQRLAGLRAHVSPNTSIAIAGTHHTRAEILAIYEASIATRTTLRTKRGEVTVALVARDEADAERRAIEAGLRNWVLGKFGATSQAALDMGYTPPKARVSTVETKYHAVQQAKLTRGDV